MERTQSLKRWARAAVWAGAAFVGLAALPAARAAADKTYEQIKLLVDILQYIKDDYVTEVDTQKLIYGAATGMVRTLDPFSQFMDPEAYKEIKTETEGQFGGLGIRIALRDNWLTVITPVPGTPAWRAGILPGDRIVKIEGISTQDASMEDALKKLRGEPGTEVSLTIARAGDEKDGEWTTKDLTLTREEIKLDSVHERMLDDKIGYMSISDFNAHTTDDVRAALKVLAGQGMQAIVLDLRFNPGGLLSSAVDVASEFLSDGQMVVYTQGRRPDSRQDFKAQADGPYRDLPMVALINQGSASGAEIVAGALQDNRRAILMGARSFGKASVQQVIPLSDGSALRLTIARYYTPNGRLIQRDETGTTGGITPDIPVTVPRDVALKLELQMDQVYEPGKAPHSVVKPEDQVKDDALDRAVEILKARDVFGRLKGS